MQFSARTKFCLRVCNINKNKSIVFLYDHFSANAAFRFALFDLRLFIRQPYKELVGRYHVIVALVLKSLFSSNDNINGEYSNQFHETLYWQAAIHRNFFCWLKIASSLW